jgi:hypothetical protein
MYQNNQEFRFNQKFECEYVDSESKQKDMRANDEIQLARWY